jgi:hypothetical protein
MNTSTCEKCKQVFTWTDEDPLCKYQFGARVILHCPHCDKLTWVRT